ncbi:hypothetical protein HNR77_002531 [Paenibacillus sp. JGP012]|uniref:DUF4238 domain-containing protein n=1 Tax=Paenibacillus sp. JGP012 TaxID=2735914 RepID=UPI001619C295|nr:DUF4238 domain-containing protein [Paenibacillus sp. JGP012]MBB6021436.1 hypothetical protein [Paenibacillus sp. JGP012]
MTTKRQHYVPRSYLKLFADSKSKLMYFDKVQSKTICNVKPEGVAVEKYFYNLDDELILEAKKEAEILGSPTASFIKKEFLENYFAGLEGGISKVFEVVNQKLNTPDIIQKQFDEVFTEEEKVGLSIFIALQSIRTPAYRELGAKFVSSIDQNLGRSFDDVDDNVKLLMQLSTGTLERVGKHLLDNFDWSLAIIGEEKQAKYAAVRISYVTDEFLISDNPVVNFVHLSENKQESYREMALPLTPKHLLVLKDKNIPSKPEKSIYTISVNDIRIYNEYQCRFSSRKVIYHKKSNEKKIKSFFNSYPRSYTHNSGSFCVLG